MFLERILAQRQQMDPPDPAQVRQWQESARRCPPARSLAEALRCGPKPRIIAEFKRASPSKGVLNAHLDPQSQARAYQQGGASAISVLTEPHFFQGSQHDLESIRASVSVPILRKDFLLFDWEIPQSRCWGADAVLLIAAALPTARLTTMLELCQDYGLEALVEVHNREEALRVADLRPPLIGINNRNLSTFRVELETTREVYPLLPSSSVIVAESGFESAHQLKDFPEIDAFLIGETLVRTDDPSNCLRQLRGIKVSTKES